MALDERMGGVETLEETKKGNNDPKGPILEEEWMGEETQS
jgi:hypothetical protein